MWSWKLEDIFSSTLDIPCCDPGLMEIRNNNLYIGVTYNCDQHSPLRGGNGILHQFNVSDVTFFHRL